ncbi:MAG: ribonuclease III [Halothiobacillus sp. 13-55-253]|nr:MAG: ribonuclease III [Halothiobacillus sp. 13-55-253]
MSALKPSSPFVTAPEKLAQHIGITFASPELLEMALRHRSAGNMNNERLEFLGDAVLNLVIANQLYTMHSKATEGELSRWRASLVREESLAVIARELDLGALEATIGAVYLDQGFDVAQALLVRLFERMLQDLPDAASLKDPKTRLQEWLQGSKRELPSYEVTTIRGQAHKQVFEVTCTLSDTQQTAVGRGSSRRKAEQAAAESMFEALSKTQQKPSGLGH